MTIGSDHVLIIDDDPYIVQSTAMVLEAEGFTVVSASSGEEGISHAQEKRPAVILLDIMMPGLNGWETLERLKVDPATMDIPVVVFSAREMQRAQRVSTDQGASEFMAKPFDPKELLVLVRKHIESRRTSAA